MKAAIGNEQILSVVAVWIRPTGDGQWLSVYVSLNLKAVVQRSRSQVMGSHMPKAVTQDVIVPPIETARLALNCSVFLSPPLAFGSTRLPNCS